MKITLFPATVTKMNLNFLNLFMHVPSIITGIKITKTVSVKCLICAKNGSNSCVKILKASKV